MPNRRFDEAISGKSPEPGLGHWLAEESEAEEEAGAERKRNVAGQSTTEAMRDCASLVSERAG